MPLRIWRILRTAALGFVADGCFSRGAAIAYYTTFALAPVLLIATAIAGIVFGEQSARDAVVTEIARLVGKPPAQAVQTMLQSLANRPGGGLATLIGAVTLLVAASGVFSEMQTALNAIWKTKPPERALLALLRARLQSLVLVLALGFMLLLSLVATTALTAVGTWVSVRLPASHLILRMANVGVSVLFTATLFASIYKMLPDTDIAWRDVGIGALVSTLLFTVGKNLIGVYIGSAGFATVYGAAGALGIILVWIYYSSQIFLFGAELTRAYAEVRGSRAGVVYGRHAHELERLRAQLHAGPGGSPRAARTAR